MKDELKKVNKMCLKAIEAAEAIEKAEWDLVKTKLTLDEVNIRIGELKGLPSSHHASLRLSKEAAGLSAKCDSISAKLPEMRAYHERLSREYEVARAAALKNIKLKNIDLNALIAAEDEMLRVIDLETEEVRIINALFEAKEAYESAQRFFEESTYRMQDSQSDPQIVRAQKTFQSAQSEVLKLTEKMKTQSEEQQYDNINLRNSLVMKMERARKELEDILAPVGLLAIYKEYETSAAFLADATKVYNEAKANADLLPLVVPLKRRERGNGAIATLLREDEEFAAAFRQFEDSLAEQEDDVFSDNEPDVAEILPAPVQKRTEALKRQYHDYVVLQRTEGNDEGDRAGQSELLKQELSYALDDIKAMREDALRLKRELDKTRANDNAIKRAKKAAANDLKRSAIAAHRNKAFIEVLEKEIAELKSMKATIE